ncbi:MAG: type II toxin-antitoxin system VapC family toxin [Deltaproteobacteria bacterium]|nr:type II toxin-antitoxin system VapC family toxin [Deltaproteobacteria bacterium]
MRLLLDTCTFIWLTQEPARLSIEAARVLDDPANDLMLSYVSVWEIYSKATAGKLRLPNAPRIWVEEQLSARGLVELPIELAALGRMSELPLHHRDPFDRLLVAQALVHRLTIVSPDPSLGPYGAKVLW